MKYEFSFKQPQPIYLSLVLVSVNNDVVGQLCNDPVGILTVFPDQ